MAVSLSVSSGELHDCLAHSYDQKLLQVNTNEALYPHDHDSLKPVPYSIPHTRYASPIVQASDALVPPNIPHYRPRGDAMLCRHLRAALYELRRRRHDEGRQTARGASEPDFGEAVRCRGVLVQ